MTNDQDRHPAEERLLDAALQQVMQASRSPARESEAVAIATSPVELRRRPTLLVAAAFLVGLSVTGALWWQSRTTTDVAVPAVQDPALPTLPPQVTARGRAELSGLDDGVQNLSLWPRQLGDLDHLKRFRKLRRLLITVPSAGNAGRLARLLVNWKALPADVLAPLGELTALETLRLPRLMHLRPKHLKPLEQCVNLRRLELAGENVVFDEPFVTALQRLPRLRVLSLVGVRLTAAVIDRLGALELEEFSIRHCEGFDARGFARLCEMKSLRTLRFEDLGRHPLGAEDPAFAWWQPTPADLERLGGLPDLKTLQFQGCKVTGDYLRALPAAITALELRSTDLEVDDFPVLARFGALRHLDLSTDRYDLRVFVRESPTLRAAKADAFAKALGSLRLTSLRFHGVPTEALLEQVAGQPDLAKLYLTVSRVPALQQLSGMPALTEFGMAVLSIGSGLQADDFRPLAECPRLRSLDVWASANEGDETALKEGDLAAVFGGKVEVNLQMKRFKVK